MPEPVVHITLDANRTLCQRSVGELAGDTYTTDIIRATSYHVKGCPDCLAALEQPRTYAELLTSTTGPTSRDTSRGSRKPFTTFRPGTPRPTTCERVAPANPVKAARIILRKMLGGVDDGRAR